MQDQKKGKSVIKDSVSYEDYHLKEGDKLWIQVYSTEDKLTALFNGSSNSSMQMSSSGSGSDLYTYSVNKEGNIQFPIIGDVHLMGKTLRESKRTLEEAIRPVAIENSVDIRMVGKSFSVIGSGKSGRFTFPKEKVNIFQALAMAGDIGLYTDRTKIRILRQSQDKTTIKTFDIRSIDIINSEFYYLEPDDVIFLQPMKTQFFGVSTFWAAISTVITTISFGTGIYSLITNK